MINLDNIDKRLLNLLQENCQTTHRELAMKLGLSVTPVFERVKKLKKHGYVKKNMAIINRKKLGFKQVVFVGITLKGHTRNYLDNFVNKIVKFKEVLECHRISGDYDYLLKIITKDIESYEKFLVTKLTLVAELNSVQSLIVLSSSKDETSIYID